MSSRSDSHLLAMHLARAINPGLASENMPVAVALLQPVALATVEALTGNGYGIRRLPPDPPRRPTLRLLQGGGECHNGICGCEPDPGPDQGKPA